MAGDDPGGTAPAGPEQDDELWRDTVELVQRAQGGDAGALDDVLARYYPRVLGVVRSRLGTPLRRYVESIDLVQEAMGEAVVAFDRFDMRNEDALIRWLARLVENRIRDLAKFYRAQKRGAAREVPLRPAGPETATSRFDPADSTLSPAERVSGAEMTELVRARVSQLPEHYREVVERRGGGGTWGEVAEAMGLESAGAARMLHARARVALMKLLAAETEG